MKELLPSRGLYVPVRFKRVGPQDVCLQEGIDLPLCFASFGRDVALVKHALFIVVVNSTMHTADLKLGFKDVVWVEVGPFVLYRFHDVDVDVLNDVQYK